MHHSAQLKYGIGIGSVQVSVPVSLYRGTDGSVFHPDVQKSDILRVFSKDLCQALPLEYKEEIKTAGISAYR